MGPLGVGEMALIFVLALLLFGPKKLPEIGKGLGKGISEFKRAMRGIQDDIENATKIDSSPK